MSSVEQQLVRDIAAVTAGVVVTEADLTQARDAIEVRLDARRRRDRRLRLAAAAVVVAVVGIVGYEALRSMADDEASAPPISSAPSATFDPADGFLIGDAPTPDSLNGVWRVDNGTLLLRFSVFDRSPDEVYFDNGGELYSDPRVQGTFAIEGDHIIVTVTGGRAGCAGQTLSMRASLPSDGAMRFVFSEPGSGACLANQGEQWVLEQVLPTSGAVSGTFFPPGDPGWAPVKNSSHLLGVWFAQGGGYALEVDEAGTYYVADESGEPVDRGHWSLQGTELTLTSTAISSQCTDGDRLVLSDVEVAFNPSTRGMRGNDTENACGGPWATKTWVHLPDLGSA